MISTNNELTNVERGMHGSAWEMRQAFSEEAVAHGDQVLPQDLLYDNHDTVK